MMKRKKVYLIFVSLIAVFFFVVYFVPRVRVNIFVHSYHKQIEENLNKGNGVPAKDALLIGYDSVNYWDGNHPMIEFIMMSYGDTYYGCYYSLDDVPLPFQNVDVKLVQTKDDEWTWKEKGDNKGTTSKIMKNWYYFEASF